MNGFVNYLSHKVLEISPTCPPRFFGKYQNIRVCVNIDRHVAASDFYSNDFLADIFRTRRGPVNFHWKFIIHRQSPRMHFFVYDIRAFAT